MARLEGKVALISGAARGQGRSHAVRLAEEGADIIAFDICEGVSTDSAPGATEADLQETIRQVEGLDRRIVAEKADVRDLDQIKRVVDMGVAELGGRLDIVAGNAGILGTPNRAHEIPDEDFVDMQEINLTGVWRTCKAAIPHMKAAGNGGSIVLTSSGAGLQANENIAHYVAAKHGVVGLMRTLALELAPEKIRVNSLHPTMVDTPMIMHDSMYQLFRPDLDNPTRENLGEVGLQMNALPIPWVEAIDISNALVWLSSDEGRYVTGVTLPVDAGVTIK
ncbi:mycofactocin-coupled SDR family oxidoreductase [Nesterenkonia alkaliphila]|uniref:Mycofactocin-coupled SDR family oxidoreductase n=1 Tax=Nesterenkonia alkaliphila TaxID=1463631 RepID=A0A7K1UFN0_9MICC|nr:mycofactocin-coupled SDR family oxidoreductase [Nesterenkonia alkaliphila]MVT25194.1 mycofactocin-coupled SDR family oxidoreductase [Nesterenkonia alkaliphila]GFZ93667.1 putative short-chain type dehydrogenase/reductase [Nesterenkonia alkaliphila]